MKHWIVIIREIVLLLSLIFRRVLSSSTIVIDRLVVMVKSDSDNDIDGDIDGDIDMTRTRRRKGMGRYLTNRSIHNNKQYR